MKRTNWSKQVTVLLAVICVGLVALSGFYSAQGQDWLLQVEGVNVGRDIYAYFLSEALIDAPKDENGVPKDLQALREDAAARCTAYVAVNSELHNMRKSLDQQLKARVADRTGYLWRVFHSYYSSIGVTKETIYAVQYAAAAKERLFQALYDVGGTRETPEESIQSYFYGNFVAYDGLRVFFTVTEEDGSERGMTQTEQTKLKTTMENLVAAANEKDARSFLELAQDEPYAAALSYALPSVNVVRKDVDLDAADFEKIRGLDPAKLSLIEMPDYLLVARGANMRLDEEEFYFRYRDDCLKALKAEDFEAALEELYAAFRTDENVQAVEEMLLDFRW